MDEHEEALIRSDKAIAMQTQKANFLTKSIGKEVALQHSFSKKIHFGIVKKVTSKNVIIENSNKEETTYKISNIDILTEKELFEWKKNNLKLEEFDLSVLFPSKCDEKYLIKMFKNIEPVIDVELMDSEDIDDSLREYTFHYTLFDRKDEKYVEEYIGSIGGTIQ